jgi:hypothetical protein
MLAVSLRHSLSHATESQNAGGRQGVSLVIELLVLSDVLSAFIFVTICGSGICSLDIESFEPTSNLCLRLHIAGAPFDVYIGFEMP